MGPATVQLGRATHPPLDLLDEASIAAAAAVCGHDLTLVIDATGFLHDAEFQPEKSLRQLDPAHLARSFALNATGPALLMKHFLPLLAREGQAVFATLSARVGSISDNRLGGWYAYRGPRRPSTSSCGQRQSNSREPGRRRSASRCIRERWTPDCPARSQRTASTFKRQPRPRGNC